MPKPILFLDFDHTLFDTGQFYDWLGEDIDGRIAAMLRGTLAEPDFASMLYPDTIDFLKHIQKTHRRVLLTYSNNIPLQAKKVASSGITTYLDAVLIVPGEKGEGGKARGIADYLLRSEDPASLATFLDDAPENISEVKTLHQEVRCVRIDRGAPAGSRMFHLQRGETAATSPEGLLPPDHAVATLDEFLALLLAVPPQKGE